MCAKMRLKTPSDLQEFALIKNGKVQRRGRINLIGRLQLSTEKKQSVQMFLLPSENRFVFEFAYG